ncbi:hypothetical protein K469DRAFT_181241 [Zopfia rhizophila CBS 207.26]|uniref:LsmAD domain-containing protein n=1 Tax=Zopfia rhizophila CBS 207.26 TaxID=1314779 RepID=A0A6A6E364_9PEZI|nr:hypothetical protein K469DRAFT_181241 [Zopfia rhizophila CBS 207.26]
MSTSAAAPSVNGSNVNGPVNPSASSNSSGGRTQLKMSTPGKGADAARKQAGSPVDGGQRKTPAQKAWTQGTNPITQRPSNLNNSNGVVNTSKSAQASQNSSILSSETASPLKHMNDRMMFLLANLTGLPSNITLKNGEKYTGVLSGTSLDPTEMRYIFKMVKRVQPAGDAQVNGASEITDDYVGVGDNYVMAFDIGDVADFHVSNVVLGKPQAKPQNGVSSGFRTDTDISGNMAVRERNLQKWEPSADVNPDLSLGSSGRTTEWDQFSTNEQLFGVKSNYDESFYTTTIDRNNPQYAERAARAEKIAREIEASSALNAHVREERGQVAGEEKGADEEEKYSGVRRDFPPLPSGQPNKYTPPARRPPTGQPTVPGAPVDPAIISSQLAQPGSTSSKPSQRTMSPPTEKRPAPEPAKLEAAPKPESPAPPKQGPTKDAPPQPDAKTSTPAKPAAEPSQKPSNTLKPAVTGIPARKPGRPDNATANVEHDLLDSFKQFSAAEKLRMSERQRSLARESKAVKLNDLKKFSQNFKLHTPVPQDLVPILAKDEGKQQLIVEKALRAVQELKSTPPKPAPTATDPKAAKASNVKPDSTHTSPSTTADRQQNQRQRPSQNHYGSASLRDRSGPNQNVNQGVPRNTGLLSTRLAINQQQHKQQGAVPYSNIPHPIPVQDMRIPPTGPSQSSSGMQTPTSSVSTRFNVRAPDFKPNPAANTFLPGGNPSTNSSPRPDSATRSEPPRKVQITSFFGGQRPTSEPLNIYDGFNPIKRMMKEAKDENKTREYANNGGIPFAFRTPPTWDFPEGNKDKGYVDMFERAPVPQPISAPHNVMNNGHMPHHQQLPHHLQQGPQPVPQAHTPQHTPRHPPVQPHHGQGGPHGHFDGHHMQFSQSTSSVHPSPRAVPPYMYNSQPQTIPVYPQQAPMQPYGMSPNVQHVALRQQAGPQFVSAPGPAMGGHMMTNQPSNGPYMTMPTNTQMPMYTPAPGAPYPHYPAQMPGPPGANGFPSPRPGGAQMMSHQGSQQGHQPQQLVYMQHGAPVPQMFTQMPSGPMTPMRGPYPQAHQPPYGSPHQHHQFPQQPHRGTPSGSYSQPIMQQHSMPPQGPLPTGPANHGPEGNEEVK